MAFDFARRLIRIKARLRRCSIVRLVNKRSLAMPIDSILVSAAVVAMFAVFAGVILWGSYQTAPRAREEPPAGSRTRRSF